MKKLALLVLALVIALPGCGKKKETSKPQARQKTVKTYAQMPEEDELVEVGEVDTDDGDMDIDMVDFSLDDISDEELDKWLTELEEEDTASEGFTGEQEMSLDEEDDMYAFNWDTQADDEFKKVYFGFNHYGVRADQKEALAYDIEQVKQLLAEAGNAHPTVVIEGHTCQQGDHLYNMGLSEKRAKSVADLFVAAGVDRSAIKVVGRGQECPATIHGKVVDGSREERAPNRRVEIHVIYT